MARLVIAAHGLRSALNNSAALARELVERGHEVTFVSFRDIRADVEHVGASFVLLGDGRRAVDELATARATGGKWRSFRTARRLRAQLLRLQEPVQTLSELDPDLVIVDLELHGCVLAAERLAIPTVLTMSWHDPTRSWRRPPMHTELTVVDGPMAAVRSGVAWTLLVAARRLRQLCGPLLPRAAVARVLPQQLNTSDYGSVRAMARNLDIDLASITSRHQWTTPHLYTHRTILSTTVEELEFDRRSPAGVVHVGPRIDVDRYQRPLDSGDLAEIDEFLERFLRSGHRVAYCSMGSLQGASLGYYQKVVDAFSDAPEWGLVLGLGSRGADLDLRTERTNVLALSDAPQLRIFDQCDVAIHTGGAGTFYECLRFGVPSIVMHTGRTDMPGIAARVRHFGLGTVRDRDEVTSEQIWTDAKDLAAGSAKGQLDEFRRLVTHYEGRSLAVGIIEERLGRSGP